MSKKETMDLFKLLGFGLGGAILSAILINNLPGIKDAKAVTKSLIQLGSGFALMLLAPNRWEIVKLAGVGAFMAGGLAGAERLSGIKTLAGPRNRISSRELDQLKIRGGVPLQLRGPMEMQRYSGPMTMRSMNGNPAFMGAGTNPAFMGRGTVGFKSSN